MDKTFYIFHYQETKGWHEYIVITNDNGNDVQEEFRKPGFSLPDVYTMFGDTGQLPTETSLVADD